MYRFDNDIAVHTDGPSRFTADISDNWSINGVPNGGYLMAAVANAMLGFSDRQATPILTANFISRCEPGPARLAVDRIAASRQFERFQASLFQGDAEKIRMLGTFADVPDACTVDRTESAAPDIPPPDECTAIPEMPGYTLFDRLDLRLDPACAGWMAGRLVDRSELRGWIRFRDGRPLDVPAILLVTDAFPPSVFATQGMVAWVPTLEISVNVRHVPKTEWLKGIFRTRFITCGLLEEDGQIWDPAGTLVAISRQIAQYRS